MSIPCGPGCRSARRGTHDVAAPHSRSNRAGSAARGWALSSRWRAAPSAERAARGWVGAVQQFGQIRIGLSARCLVCGNRSTAPRRPRRACAPAWHCRSRGHTSSRSRERCRRPR
eukprot:3115143-Prymnesium_polylepis.2